MNDLVPRRHNAAVEQPETGMTVLGIAEHMARSGFFADIRDASQAVIKILAGRELGLGPIASTTGIHVIKGKVALGANLLASLLKASGKYDYRIREFTEKVCTIEAFERGESLGSSTFTYAEAERAGLTAPSRSGEPSNWVRYPRNMLFARAMSNLVKFYAPDLMAGPVYTPEELGAVIDGETGEILALPPQQQAAPARRMTEAEAEAAPRPGEAGDAPRETAAQTRRQQWEAGYAQLLHDATFVEVPLEPLEKFFLLQSKLADLADAELFEAIKELRSLVKLRKLELEEAAEAQEAEERHRTLDAKMDRANADEDPR